MGPDSDSLLQSVVIAVPTGGRSEELQRLLTALVEEYASRPDVRLLVVDNGPEANARATFDALTGPFGERRRYVREARRGYSSARNAVLGNIDGAAAVVMIDDDEVPEPGWLDRLLTVQAETGAEVVVGPVLNEYPPGVPGWYAESGVFGMDAPDYPEGHEMPWCATNNTLVTKAALDLVPEGFDPKFNTMSGEDTHFFLRARLRGCRIVWTRTAVVREYLQPGRFNRAWLFKRAMRSGNTTALVERELLGDPRTIALRVVKATGLLGFGVLSTLVAAGRRDRALGLRGVYRIGRGCGMAWAFATTEPWSP